MKANSKNAKKNHRSSYSDEIVAIMLLAIAILLFLCLISHNENDPSVVTSSSEPIKNLVGVVGANISAILLSAMGWSAYALPVLLAVTSFQIFRLKSDLFDSSRLVGFVLFIITTSGLISIFDGYGAIVGTLTAQVFTYLLGKIGAVVLLSSILVASVLLITGFSLSFFLDGFKTAFRAITAKLEALTERYRNWRRERKRKKLERKIEQVRGASDASASDADEETPKVQVIREESRGTESEPAIVRNSDELRQAQIGHDEYDEIEDSGAVEIEDAKISGKITEPAMQAGSSQPSLAKKSKGETKAEIEEKSSPVNQNFENYVFPPIEFLTSPPPHFEQRDEELLAVAEQIVEKTKEFNVTGRVVNICRGPVVTTYEFKPDPGVKYSRIVNLADDLCLALKAESIRIDRIPGKAYVGIEVPNVKRETIFLREIIESRKFREAPSLLTIALGKTIDGANYVTDLAKMPHLLIAGATGSGKSVGVNALIVSILYKARPDEVKFIMVDPKRLELGVYADIPHLATPIITDPKRAAVSLKWAVSEMERRYKYLAGWGVRNIDGYNAEIEKRNAEGRFDPEGKPWRRLPYIVIIIDEFADLMMVAGNDVEESVTRLAQMARAVGIHLVLATQRPSVDVITGLIKANFPSRIAFRVSSKVDSRTIIDTNGAERLLGKGDMLFLPPGTSQLVRIHGAYVEEKEIFKIVEHIKSQGVPEYDETITKTEEEMEEEAEMPSKTDPLFWEALRVVVNARRASTSLLQRHLRIGYGRAAAILDAMVRAGYVGEMDNALRARPVLPAAFDALAELEQNED